MGSCKNKSHASSAQANAMAMLWAAAWVGDQKVSGLKISEWRSYGLHEKPIACKIGPNQNDEHALGGGMGWLSKTFGPEKLSMALLWNPVRTDRLQYRPKPER